MNFRDIVPYALMLSNNISKMFLPISLYIYINFNLLYFIDLFIFY